jgi:hypothetical protein
VRIAYVADRENTATWLAGRSDDEHFGKLRNF